MILSQLKNENYKLFGRQSPENKAQNIAALQYLEDLAGRTGVQIGHWNLETLFKDPEARSSFHLLRDRNKINKIFFDHTEHLKRNKGGEFDEIEKSLKQVVDKISQERLKKQVERLKQIRDGYVKDAEMKFKAGADLVANAFKSSQDIAKLSGIESGLSTQILDVLKAGFWDFLEFNGTHISFVTNQAIINTEVNPSAGLDLRVNLGRFKVVLQLENLNIQVLKYKDNLNAGSYWHPHVSSSGTVCWGNASGNAAKAMGEGRIKDLLELLATLLSTYSSTSPHQSLIAFSREAPETDKRVIPTKVTDAVEAMAEVLHGDND